MAASTVGPAARTARLLTAEDTRATPLLIWAVDRFGPELWDWAPATIAAEARAELGQPLPRANFDRLMAAIAIAGTDLFHKDAGAFVRLAGVLSGDAFQPDEFDPPTAAECAWALTEAALLDPPGDDPEPYAPEVRRYLGGVLREEGFLRAPDVLGIALGLPDPSRLDLDPAERAEAEAAQDARDAAIAATIRAGLAAVRDQLAALELRNGTTAAVVSQLDRALGPKTTP